MSDKDIKTGETPVEGKGRREFLKSAAQVAVTAPAVAMLLSATTKPASAQAAYGDGTDATTGDHSGQHDFTGGDGPVGN